MAGLLHKHKHKITTEQDADVIVLNLCTVKGDHNAIKQATTTAQKYPNKKLIFGGCLLTETIDKLTDMPNVAILNTYNIDKIVEITEQLLQGNQTQSTHYNNFTKVDQPKLRNNPHIGIIAISNGCLSHCAYCSVKRIKGNLTSFPKEKIINDAKTAIKQGCKELWLTSQDNGCYGFDNNSNLAQLTKEITQLPGDFKIRLGMASPQHLTNFLPELIDVLKNKKVFTFLHLPIQSGNNEVLKAMQREHTIEEFKDLINELRKNVANLTLSTDIICGFPTETDEQFQDTVNLLDEIQFDAVNISRYQKREYTQAAKLPQLQGRITKQRSRQATKHYLKNAQEKNIQYLNTTQQVTITERGKNDSFVARTQNYKPVILKGNYKLGQTLNVQITSITPYDLRAEVI